VFGEIAAVPVDEDGLVFLGESIVAEAIREAEFYAGVRLKLRALLGSMRIALQVDVGTGDSLVPEPVEVVFPALVGGESPVLRAYARELVVAEKFEAMVKFGEANSRMKDFFDVWFLATRFDLDRESLRAAIIHTFARRGTPLPASRPFALTDAFARSPAKQSQWKAFLAKSGIERVAPTLDDACETAWQLLASPLASGADG